MTKTTNQENERLRIEMHDLPIAEDLPYWKTSKSTPDVWLDRAESIIEKLGGEVTLRARGKRDGNIAFLMDFVFPPEQFRAVWPVLPSSTDNIRAAERQAATMLYHDIKSRALRCRIVGPRTAFFEFLLLPDGRTTSQVSNHELTQYTPKQLLPSAE